MDAATELPQAVAAGTRRIPSRPGEEMPSISRHTPGSLALSERRRADLWRNLALLVCFAALGLAFLTIRAGRATDLVYVLDPQGNVYAGPLEPLADSKRFFNTTAIYATNAALQRSPAGFDLPELLKLYFTPRAVAKLQEDHKHREADMRQRNLQWKPLIESITEPVAAGTARMIEVRGRLVVAGAFARRTFYDELPVCLVLTFVRNPDIGKAGAYPWVCSEVETRIDGAGRKAK